MRKFCILFLTSPLLWTGVWGLYLLLVIVFSLIPLSLPQTVPSGDKILHFLTYAGLAMLWPRKHAQGLRAAFWAALVGALLELGQGILPTGRYMEFWDVVANALGALLGVFLLWIGQKIWPRLQNFGGRHDLG